MSLELAVHHYALECLCRADMDYISARLNYRLGFTPTFLWSSQQAVEKYLKAAILTNGGSLRLTHDTSGLWEEFLHRVLAHRGMPINFPKWLPKYIHHLSVDGTDRYGSNEVFQLMYELFELDEAVWTIRRYCIDHTSFPVDGKTEAELSRIHLETIQQYFSLDRKAMLPQPFINGGVIEQVLRDDVRSRRRQALSYANWYFSDRKRFRGNLTVFSASRSAVHQRSAVRRWLAPTDGRTIDPARASQLENRIAFPQGSLEKMLQAQRRVYESFEGEKIRKNFAQVTAPEHWVTAHPFTGNRGTKSLHRFGCKEIGHISSRKRQVFLCMADALDDGYTLRCKCC